MRWSLLLFLTFLGAGIGAQNCTLILNGQVLDRATKEPLEFSSIAIQEGNRAVMADSLGAFQFRDLCPGAYHVQAFHVGCPPGHYFLEIHTDSMVTFYLDHHGELLKEVIVEGHPGAFQETQTRQSISQSKIREQVGQSLSDMVSDVAGVQVLRNGSGISKPVIHGLYGNRIAIINNGMLQAGQQWGTDHAPEVDPNAADRITVVKGSDAIEYGSMALGGALLVEAGPIEPDPHLHGSIGYGFESNGRVHAMTSRWQKSLEKWDWRVTGTVKRSGDHRAPEYFLTNTGTSEWGGSIQLQNRVSARQQHAWLYSFYSSCPGIFAGAHISNLTDLEEAIGRDTPFRVREDFSYGIEAPRQQVGHHLFTYAGKRFVKEDQFWEWAYGLQLNHRQEFDIRRGDRSDVPALDLRQWSHILNVKFLNEGGNWKKKSGIQVRWTDNENDADTGILPLIPDYLRGTVGLYHIVQREAGKMTLEGGLRYDLQTMRVWAITQELPREIIRRDHLYHDMAISFGATYRHSPVAQTRLHLAAARRSPEANELYSNGLHQGIAGIEEGDWTLKPETSIKAVISPLIHVGSWFHLEVNAYSHLILQYMYLQPQDELRLTIRGAFPVYRYTQEDAWLRGADVVLVSDFSHHLEWTSRFSWIRGTSLAGETPLSLMPPWNTATTLSWAFHDHAIWKGARVALEAEYTARQHRWDEESEWVSPPPDYFLVHLSFTTGIRLKSNLLHVGVGIDNVFNTAYRNYLNRLRYFADENGRNVYARVRMEF